MINFSPLTVNVAIGGLMKGPPKPEPSPAQALLLPSVEG